MKEVGPEAVMLHLSYNEAFTGVSRAAGFYEGFGGVGSTEGEEETSCLVSVFGERVTLLEGDKRAGAENELTVRLLYSGAPQSSCPLTPPLEASHSTKRADFSGHF